METEVILMWSGIALSLGVALNIIRVMFGTYKD